MKKRFTTGLVISIVLSLILSTSGFAGASAEYGRVPGAPPLGSVNWLGWNDSSYYGNPYPNMVMTEDATNSSLGPDQGYSNPLGDTPIWLMIPENLDPAPVNNISLITVILGGLGTYSGGLWSSHFKWSYLVSMTDHGEAAAFSGVTPCPNMTSTYATPTENVINWEGPAGDYYVYRSQNGSGAEPNNGLSSGKYYFLDAVTATAGSGTYTDTTGAPYSNWYIVVHFNHTTGAIDGCHSEEAHSTAVDVVGFVAAPQAARAIVDLGWNSTEEIGLTGFNVYRSLQGDANRQRINASLINVQNPGSSEGSHYTFIDTGVKSGLTYDYWVEILRFGSEPQLYGPQEVTAPYGYFIPMVKH